VKSAYPSTQKHFSIFVVQLPRVESLLQFAALQRRFLGVVCCYQLAFSFAELEYTMESKVSEIKIFCFFFF